MALPTTRCYPFAISIPGRYVILRKDQIICTYNQVGVRE